MDKLPPPIFISDSPALNFLNSVATPIDSVVDWIHDGNGLLDWLARAQLVPKAVLAAIVPQALPGELDQVAAQARNLREWFRGFVYKHKGRRLSEKALQELDPLNKLLERDEAFYRITTSRIDGDERMELSLDRHWRSPEALLLSIAEAFARLACSKEFQKVKACEGSGCTLLFVDETRGGGRRWCSMAICGNREKQKLYRKRSREQQR